MECIICKEYKELFHNLTGCAHRVCNDCKECMLSSSLCYTVVIGEKCLKCPECREIEKMPYEVLLKKAKYMERDLYTLVNMLKSKEIENYELIKKKNKCEEEKGKMEGLIKLFRRKKSGECNCGCISKKTKKVTITRRRCSAVSCENYCCRACEVCLVHK